MDLYAHHERFDDALKIFEGLYSNNPEVVVTPIKLIGLATSLLKGDRTEDALKVLQHLKPSAEKTEQMTNALDMCSWRMLNVTALKGDVELTRKLFEILEKSEIKITNMVLGPLIKVHLAKYDILICGYSKQFYYSFIFIKGAT